MTAPLGGAPADERAGGDEAPPTRLAWYTLGVLTIAYTVSLVDRKLPFILADSIKRDLNLSDTQLGLVTGAMFAIVYATVAVPIATLADRTSRKRLIAAAVFAWSALTAAGGLAQNFWQLASTRMGVAVGESVLTPSGHSMIADLFANRYRARAIAIYFLGGQLGILIGLAVGGWINEMADWRVAMLLLGVPGILLTLLIVFTLKEPTRIERQKKAAAEPSPPVLQVIWMMARQPTLIHLVIASTLASAASGGLQAFLPSHVVRTFHMGTASIGLTYGLAMGLAGFTGVLLGGVVGDWLRRKSPWKALGFVGIGEAIGVPCIALAVLAPSYPLFLVLVFLSHTGGSFSTGPTYATLQSLMRSSTHARATAIFLFCVSGMGLAMGPLVTGMMSDAMSSMGAQASLQTALLILAIPKLWASAHYMLSAWCLRRHDRVAEPAPGGERGEAPI